MNSTDHNHQHGPNRFAVVPTHVRLDAHNDFRGRGVTIAFLDSGFYPHSDLVEPLNRITAYTDLTGERPQLDGNDPSETWQWHGTQTSVAAAGNGTLSAGAYRGLASESNLVLVKVSKSGRISEDNIALGIQWVIENRKRYDIRILNISLGGDQDVPCSRSIIDQAAEEAIAAGIVVVVAAGNSGHEGKHSIPPANSPSVITVGGYTDNNQLDGNTLDLYQSNFGFTADGTLKPEIIGPAMWVAAPILPGTSNYRRAEALSQLFAAVDYELPARARELAEAAGLPIALTSEPASSIRSFVETSLNENKIVASHYQHVDGTSFAAPIVSSIVAQMLEANPNLTPAAVKNILVSTASRIPGLAVLRQGFGVVNAKRSVERALLETHELRPNGCSSIQASNGRVRFLYHNDEADTVTLAGDFNNWNTSVHALMKSALGLWEVEIVAPRAGRYHYKFLVNGTDWREDPENGLKAPDSFGGLNSILVVE